MIQQFNFNGSGGGLRRSAGKRRQTGRPLNQETIFRTFEGSDESLHFFGPGPEIIH